MDYCESCYQRKGTPHTDGNWEMYLCARCVKQCNESGEFDPITKIK